MEDVRQGAVLIGVYLRSSAAQNAFLTASDSRGSLPGVAGAL
jgi:hypothetical protein